jgi:glucose/arabinose dehydrogenase
MTTMNVRKNIAVLTVPLIGILLFAEGVFAGEPTTPLRSVRVASGLSSPLFATAPANDPRLFIVERGGRIKILADGQVLATPFLDISGQIVSGGEQGLLGLAFHPDYIENGYFYVNFTEDGGIFDRTVIARFQVSADPNIANAGSRLNVLTYTQPYSNHNGGMIAFGPNDGYLYIASGDGGLFNDPQDNGQDTGVLLGKMLRLDIDSTSPYAIPMSNPLVDEDGARGEIWAYGLRNPWRFSFDRATGDLYIADVGQGAREEVNFQPAASGGGENYGWDIAEGFACLGGSGNCGTNPGFTPPIHDYDRDAGQSVTGGYVYRGGAIPDLQGTYFFADYVANRIWSFRYDGQQITEFVDRTAELEPAQGTVSGISSFGEDADGALYFTSLNSGEVFKIIRGTSIGDVNGDGDVNALDVQLVINAALGLPVTEQTDLNDDQVTNALDVQLVINAALGLI